MQLLGIGLDLENLIAGLRAGVIGKERNQQFAGIDVTALCEWISGNHIFEFVWRADYDIAAKAEALFNRILNPFG